MLYTKDTRTVPLTRQRHMNFGRGSSSSFQPCFERPCSPLLSIFNLSLEPAKLPGSCQKNISPIFSVIAVNVYLLTSSFGLRPAFASVVASAQVITDEQLFRHISLHALRGTSALLTNLVMRHRNSPPPHPPFRARDLAVVDPQQSTSPRRQHQNACQTTIQIPNSRGRRISRFSINP